jgi:predicted NACHT family NTPase
VHEPGRVTAPGAVPLLSARGLIVTGAAIRAVRHRWRPVHTIAAPALMRHFVIVGSSGSGKTNLLMRL